MKRSRAEAMLTASNPNTAADAREAAAKTDGARVHFIGAGPGDPELITLKAARLISTAEVVIYAGSLVNPEVLAHATPAAQVYDSAGMELAEQIQVMAAAVAQGFSVARLHTGDPAVYGSILEQMRELDRLGIPYDIVPGVSSAFAAAAALGIEYTVPGDTQTVIFTRMGGKTAVPERERLRHLAAHRTSLVLFLSAGMISQVVDELQAAGYSPDTPVAVVARASWPDELVVRGRIDEIARRSEAAEITHQALIVVSPALRADAARAAPDSYLYGAAQRERENTRADAISIVALTRKGSETGARLQGLLPGSVLYLPERFRDAVEPGTGQVIAFTTSVRQALHDAFTKYRAVVAIMSTGIVVRDLAPLLRSKYADPAVVIVDEQGRHAISLLGGHKGGGNELAQRVAQILGGTAVITTASDVKGLPALDLIGGAGGWRTAGCEAMTAVSAALVNGEALGAVQEAGDESWWPEPLPPNLTRYPSLEALAAVASRTGLSHGLVITHRSPAEVANSLPNLVVYHPPCLVLGIGCNRGTASSEIQGAADATLAAAGLAPASVYLVATVEDKAAEPGLLEACRERGWRLHAFSRDELAAAGDPPNPSHYAQTYLGVPGVAEPAAMLAGLGRAGLLATKMKFPNVTVAVARAPSENWQPRLGREIDLSEPQPDERGGHV